MSRVRQASHMAAPQRHAGARRAGTPPRGSAVAASRAKAPRGRAATLAVLALCVLVASIPVLVSYLPAGHDLSFHLYRIEGIAQGLAAGEFPVRMQTSQIGGYGFPVSICYGDALLYPFAALRLLGVSLNNCYRLLVVSTNVFTAAASYVCFSRMAHDRFAGTALAVVWTLSPYRLIDVFLRAAVGEYLALSFFPVVALGVWSIFAQGKPEAARHRWLVLALGMSGIVLSHVLSVFMAILVVVPICLVGLLVCKRRRRLACLRQLVLAAAVCLMLCLFFIVPFLSYYLGADLAVETISDEFSATRAYNNAVNPGQLLELFPTMSGENQTRTEGVAGEMPLAVGWAVLSMGAFAIAVAFSSLGRECLRIRVRAWVAILLAAGVGLLVTVTWLFPWQLGFGDGVLAWIVVKLGVVQFPWRFIGPGSFMFIAAAALAAPAPLQCDRGSHALAFVSLRSAEDGGLRRLSLVSLAARLALALACAFAFVEGGYAATSFLQEAALPSSEDAIFSDISLGQSGAKGLSSGEYLLDTTDKMLLYDNLMNEPSVEGDAEVSSYARQGSTRLLHVDTGNDGAQVMLPMLWYPGYELALEGTGDLSGVELLSGDNGVAVLSVPANTSADVTIYFATPLLWRVADVISLLAWVSLALWLVLTSRFGFGKVSRGRRF